MPLKNASFSTPLEKPLVIGTGLIALDVVINKEADRSPRNWAGGTCGNVLIALSYLGWNSAPVARFAEGLPTGKVLEDLKNCKVSTRFISVDQNGSTPIIIQRIGRRKSGEPYHTFSWRCPACGSHLPGYRPVLASTANELKESLGTPRVFFFDRLSRGALILARACSEQGAVVVFEPANVGDPRLFREAWSVSHIVKYSHERLRDIADVELSTSERSGVLLEVETLGAEGLRYRSRLPHCKSTTWQNVKPFNAAEVKDAAGAGDWCTAGILDKLARHGSESFQKTNAETLISSLRYGQALAAWNCGFEGARGGMYSVTKQEFERQIESILRTRKVPELSEELDDNRDNDLIKQLCPGCKSLKSTLTASR